MPLLATIHRAVDAALRECERFVVLVLDLDVRSSCALLTTPRALKVRLVDLLTGPSI